MELGRCFGAILAGIAWREGEQGRQSSSVAAARSALISDVKKLPESTRCGAPYFSQNEA